MTKAGVIKFPSVSPASFDGDVEQFFNLGLDMLCIAGVDGVFKKVNRAFTETLGYTTEELCSQPFASYIHPGDVERTAAVMRALSDGQYISDFENRYRCKDGSYRTISWKCSPVGELIYASARDVTVERQNQAAVLLQNEMLLSIIEVQTAIANANLDRRKVAAIAIEHARKLTHARGALLLSIDADELVFTDTTEVQFRLDRRANESRDGIVRPILAREKDLLHVGCGERIRSSELVSTAL